MAGTKNKISDLNNILFEQLERLNDESLSAEQLKIEMHRGKAITNVANSIIENGKLAIEAEKLIVDYGCERNVAKLPKFLEE